MDKIKQWDLVTFVVNTENKDEIFQVIGYEVMGRTAKKWIVSNGTDLCYKYEQELIKYEGKKKVGFKNS